LKADEIETVLVVEYGVLDDDDPTIILPPWNHTVNPEYIFTLESTPQPGLDGSQQLLQAGAVVGGGSAVDGKSDL